MQVRPLLPAPAASCRPQSRVATAKIRALSHDGGVRIFFINCKGERSDPLFCLVFGCRGLKICVFARKMAVVAAKQFFTFRHKKLPHTINAPDGKCRRGRNAYKTKITFPHRGVHATRGIMPQAPPIAQRSSPRSRDLPPHNSKDFLQRKIECS